MSLSAELAASLRDLCIAPFRLLLETPGVQATVPMLRGVWGRALHLLDQGVYRDVFGVDSESDSVPRGYVLRPALPDPAFAPAVEWIVIGTAIEHLPVLARAWDVACGMGLGASRHPFHIRSALPLRPDGSSGAETTLHAAATTAWPLARAGWPFAPPETTPCRLLFPAPLRLRRGGRLVEQPTLADIVVAIGRRCAEFLPAQQRPAWQSASRSALEQARSIRCGPWQGDRLDLHRYSGRQQAELDLHGVSGSLELPAGPGEIWPLLAAARWLHVGKATVMGLGQLYF